MMTYLLIENSTHTYKLKISDIVFIIAQNGQLRIEMITKQKFYHCQSLKYIEKRLPDYFLKINRNLLVNAIYMTGIDKGNKTVLLENGCQLQASRRQMPFVTKFISKFVDDTNKNTLKDIVKLLIG